MNILATAIRGFEEYSAYEAELLGCRAVETRQARVVLEGDYSCVYVLNNFARTVNKILLLLSRETVQNLDDIYNKALSIDYSFIKPDQSFAVRSERSGIHEFTSLDIARVVGQAIIDSYQRSTGKILKVNLDEPDVEIEADLIGNELFISINTTGNGLNFREYRVYNHPSSLKPTLASSLIIMSQWEGSSFIDPFTGGATIPIEAALYAKSSLVKPSGNFLYKKLSFYDDKAEEEALKKVGKKFDLKDKIVGVEISRKHFTGALKNVSAANLGESIDIILGDSIKIDFQRKFKFLVSNPPYGIRSGRKEKVLKIYELFVKRMDKILEDKARGVMITTEYKKLTELLGERGYKVLKVNTGLHGKLWVGAVLFSV
ncbi:MAG: tRNA (guanine(6)-N2)-methyltransferase [Nitrososphaeria archaeon]